MSTARVRYLRGPAQKKKNETPRIAFSKLYFRDQTAAAWLEVRPIPRFPGNDPPFALSQRLISCSPSPPCGRENMCREAHAPGVRSVQSDVQTLHLFGKRSERFVRGSSLAFIEVRKKTQCSTASACAEQTDTGSARLRIARGDVQNRSDSIRAFILRCEAVEEVVEDGEGEECRARGLREPRERVVRDHDGEPAGQKRAKIRRL